MDETLLKREEKIRKLNSELNQKNQEIMERLVA